MTTTDATLYQLRDR